MFVIARKMPGERMPAVYRLSFQTAIGARPAGEIQIEGSGEQVRQFLMDRVELDPARTSRVISDLEAYSLGSAECDLAPDELRNLQRTLRTEAKAAETKASKTSVSASVVESASITV